MLWYYPGPIYLIVFCRMPFVFCHVIVWSQNATYWSIWCFNEKRRIAQADIPYFFGFGVRFFATIPLLVICYCISQPPCTVLTAGICLPWWLCKGAVSGLEIPTGHVRPQCIACKEFPNLYLDQPITQLATRPIGGHVSCNTDSLIATRAGYRAVEQSSHMQSYLWVVSGSAGQPRGTTEPQLYPKTYCPPMAIIQTMVKMFGFGTWLS